MTTPPRSAPTSVSGRTSATPTRPWPRPSTRFAALPGTRLRGVSRLYATAPVGVTDQPDFRNAVVALDAPAGPDPETGALELLATLKDARARVRAPASSSLGPARARPRPPRLRAARGSRVERPAEARSIDADDATRRRPRGCSRSRTPRRRPACSCSRRWPTSLRVSSRPAGARRSRPPARRREIAEGPDAVRVVGTWDARARRWEPVEADQPR